MGFFFPLFWNTILFSIQYSHSYNTNRIAHKGLIWKPFSFLAQFYFVMHWWIFLSASAWRGVCEFVAYLSTQLYERPSLSLSLLLMASQRNQVQSGSASKRSRLTPGRQACHLEWGCQGSGPGTPSLSGSRWPCSCKWQPRSPSTVQVRAYHGDHVQRGQVVDELRGMEALYVAADVCGVASSSAGFKEWSSHVRRWLVVLCNITVILLFPIFFSHALHHLSP